MKNVRMAFRKSIGHQTYSFPDLKTLLAKASAEKSGDQLAGIAAATAEERIAARWLLADLPLKHFYQEQVIPSDSDEVSKLIESQTKASCLGEHSSMTVGELRDWLLHPQTTLEKIEAIRPGLTPEMISAVAKLMRQQDLILAAQKISVQSRFNNTLGLPGRFSTRLQPNHPTDDLKGIAATIIDGLSLGSGDAVIGVNPATDNIQQVTSILQLIEKFILEFEIPTQSCVLSHVTTQMQAVQNGAPLDLMFQSIGGTQATNESFGISLALLKEAHEMALSLKRGKLGSNVMYFETGQGSSLSAQAHHGVDQQTCEVRAYAVAREYSPLLVNSVVGFIGPEYLFDGKQIQRAGLEDHFAGKLMGLPMGVDVCYTTHAKADEDDSDSLLSLLALAGCNYIMGVPGADDIMLNYQSTSFHDALYVREVLGKPPAPEFEAWLNGFHQQARMIEWAKKI
jgi:ethanolamine ammonia-lyase large subunit